MKMSAKFLLPVHLVHVELFHSMNENFDPLVPRESSSKSVGFIQGPHKYESYRLDHASSMANWDNT